MWTHYHIGKYHIHYCLKCFENKNVVVASLDIEFHSIVQGDRKTTNRLCQKNTKKNNDSRNAEICNRYGLNSSQLSNFKSHPNQLLVCGFISPMAGNMSDAIGRSFSLSLPSLRIEAHAYTSKLKKKEKENK
jgi:hypothetical protein